MKRLVQGSLAASTWQSYDAAFARFRRFCRSRGVSPLPASQTTVLHFMVSLFAASPRPSPSTLAVCLAAIGRAHRDCGYPSPVAGPLVADARRGFARLAAPAATPLLAGASVAQPALAARPVVRVPLPLRIARAALQLFSFTSRATLRRDAALVLCGFLFMLRASSLVALRIGAVAVTDEALRLRVDVAKRGRGARFLSVPLQGDTACAVAVALAAFCRERARASPPGAPLFALPAAASPSAAVTAALSRVLDALGFRPPPDTAFSAHSLRSGGATAALAAGAPLPVVMAWGGWQSM